jgi:uncharacterized protein YdhG (YjbR/CyaY superfamily)
MTAAMQPFREEHAMHKTGKGKLQIPYDQPLPDALIREIAACRVKDVRENDARWMQVLLDRKARSDPAKSGLRHHGSNS